MFVNPDNGFDELDPLPPSPLNAFVKPDNGFDELDPLDPSLLPNKPEN